MFRDDAKIILIRHGESQGNAKKIYLGHADYDISENGKKQAIIAARYFKDLQISCIYSSDLLRAYNTALPHAELRGMDVKTSEQLREIYLGEWEETEISTLIEVWGDDFEIEWKLKFGSFTPPGGESVFSAGKRFYNELLKIAKNTDGKVIVVAHAAVIRAFWGFMSGIEGEKWGAYVPFPLNASASFVGFDGDKLFPIEYSFAEYLKDFGEKSSISKDA